MDAENPKPKPKAGFQTAKAAAKPDPEAPEHRGYPNAEGILSGVSEGSREVLPCV